MTPHRERPEEQLVHIRFDYHFDGAEAAVIIDDRCAPRLVATEFLMAFSRSHDPRMHAYLVEDGITTCRRLCCEGLWGPPERQPSDRRRDGVSDWR
ncbi:hypothetical protein ACIBCD_15060 [Nocardia brasiliensis]|uniref:hypothetical protein n=1 Tax=Nocardia brasiliensis TaxID=37326 RepID=UPI0004A7482E|nr:hypothetical protein [Nocardia brasiliensis]